MFGGGWTEWMIIGVVALIVIGPKDLPIVMRKIGRMVGTVRRMGTEFQRELNKTTGLDQITDLRRSLTEPLRQTSEEIRREFNKVTTTGVEPSGAILPSPGSDNVYDQITANAGVTPAATPEESAAAEPLPFMPPPVMKPLAAAEPSPAPPEATVPLAAASEASPKPKRAPRAKVAAAPKPEQAAAPKASTARTARPRRTPTPIVPSPSEHAVLAEGALTPTPTRRRARAASAPVEAVSSPVEAAPAPAETAPVEKA